MARLSSRLVLLASVTISILGLSAPPLAAQVCFGDCNRDRRVTVDEIVMGIGFALDQGSAFPLCYAFDPNFDEHVDVADLMSAVTHLLDGCGLESFEELESRRQENLAKWRALGIDDYEIDYQRHCFCFPPSDARILVRDSAIVSVINPANGEEIENPVASGFTSIDGLFGMIADAIEQHVVTLNVEYHPQLGYPVQVSIDYVAPIVDEEITIIVTDLRPQPD